MATVTGTTSIGITLGIRPGSGVGLSGLYRTISQALPLHKWTYGAGDYQMNRWYENAGFTIAPAGSTSFNLADGSLLGLNGESVAFTYIKLIWIYSPSTSNLDLGTITGDFVTDNLATSIPILPSSALVISTPIRWLGVTAPTSDVLTVNNSGTGSQTFQMFIGGH